VIALTRAYVALFMQHEFRRDIRPHWAGRWGYNVVILVPTSVDMMAVFDGSHECGFILRCWTRGQVAVNLAMLCCNMELCAIVAASVDSFDHIYIGVQ
jgi:hypothetical protein